MKFSIRKEYGIENNAVFSKLRTSFFTALK